MLIDGGALVYVKTFENVNIREKTFRENIRVWDITCQYKILMK